MENNTDTFSDSVLIKAYLHGDDKAFELLYNRYRKQLYGYLHNLLRNFTWMLVNFMQN